LPLPQLPIVIIGDRRDPATLGRVTSATIPTVVNVTPDSERMIEAERRGWVFECVGEPRPQATLIDADDDARGQHFVGEGEDALADLLDRVEDFDRGQGRLV
jgi:hypothetical protein